MGSGVGGNSSSSTSNLSALAPPFTVERSNPKFSSIPILCFSDSSYATAPNSQTWQYPHPSAPGPELNIDSKIMDHFPFAHSSPTPISPPSIDWSVPISPPSTNWSALSSNAKTSTDVFSYAGEVKPYYSPYVSTMVGKDNPSVVEYEPFYDPRPTSGPDLSSQVDYVQSLSGLEYAPQWHDAWAFDDGKQAKRVELDGSFSSKKVNIGDSLFSKSYISPGVHSIEYGNNCKEDFGISHGKLSHVSGRESHIGSSTVGHMDDRSCLEQNLSFLPYESSRMPKLMSGSAYPESCPLEPSLEGFRNFTDYQKQNSPYEKCLQPLESSFNGSISVTRSTPAVVLRPPPAGNSLLAENATHKTVDVDNISGVLKAEFDDSNRAKQNDLYLGPIEGSFDAGQFTSQKKGNDHIPFTPPSVKELSSQVHSKEILDNKIKARCGSHLPDINVSNDVSLAVNSVQVVKPIENSSYCLDNYAPAVDSPCWKGAPVSHFLAFDDVEVGKSPCFKKKSEECYDFDHETHKLFLSLDDSKRASSQKQFEGHKSDENRCAGNIMPLPPSSESNCDAKCPTIEESSTDALKDGFEISSMNSRKGVGISNPLHKPRKEFSPNDSVSCYDQKITNAKHSSAEASDIPYRKLGLQASTANSVTTFNDSSEGGAVAFHAAENVLCSPSSQEDASEVAKEGPDPNLDVQSIINAIRALSELLVKNSKSDAIALEEHNFDALKHVISNLEACMTRKIVHRTLNKDPIVSTGDISGKIVDTHDMATLAGKPQVTNEALNSHAHLDYQQLHEEKRGDLFPGKKAESSSLLSPLRGDADLSTDDNMAQAIKKVLEENFLYDEEMEPQVLLFKNLWLEAEAKLCSISYKARFDHMKIEMEKFKSNKEEGNIAVVEKMLKFQNSPNPRTESNRPPADQDGAFPKLVFQNASVPSTSGNADDVVSVMERFHILKSRKDSKDSVKSEEELQEMVDCEHAGSKTPAHNNGDDVEASVMDRFCMLKSRNDNSRLINIEDEQQPMKDDFEYMGKKNLGPCTQDQSEGENLNVDMKPYFPLRTGSLDEGNFGSFVDARGYESGKELHLPVTNDQVVIQSLTNDMLINQFSSGWYDNSSSDWEHGCDGSVLIDSTPSNIAEKDSPANNPSLRGFEVIDSAKARLEAICQGVVSCADILAFAARDSVEITGGFGYDVPAGRRDGRISLASEIPANLPPSTFNVDQLTQSFANKGFTQDEMVTLSGKSTCSYYIATCGMVLTPLAALIALPSVADFTVSTLTATAAQVIKNAQNQFIWRSKFAAAMVKMGQIGVSTGDAGEIRAECRVING
ncbi:unnamed protein product [Fraxinus pennsylvanica]|uniref:peroxidase n=1 Tax=Fraxinus pennsylvanica TaxID=56036 RepID=A0AAD1ZI88_9LAMI|nr:unnamed protein product [Fraxinus pennsylvanica]